jgi:NAD(P)-dependent dehydrogenase (short-subunit alcohol dehydrogenase family)
MRLKDKIAIVVGAGQSPGAGLGNGRATVLRFMQEGAMVLAVDNNLSSAEETVAMAKQSGGECLAFEADVANETTLAAMVEVARRRWGRIEVLHYNVGVSIATSIEPQLWGIATTPIGQRRPNEEEAKWTRLSSA